MSEKGHKLFFIDFEMTRFPYFTLDFYLFKILVLSFSGDQIPFPGTLLVDLSNVQCKNFSKRGAAPLPRQGDSPLSASLFLHLPHKTRLDLGALDLSFARKLALSLVGLPAS